MKNKMIPVIITFALLLLMQGCSGVKTAGNEEINTTDPELRNLINLYITENEAFSSRGGELFAEHYLFGAGTVEGKTHVYIWAYSREYYVDSGKLQTGSAGSYPLVIVLEKTGVNGYRFLDHMVPESGNRYQDSVRELFPQKYHRQIFSRPNLETLQDSVEQKALQHLGLEVGSFAPRNESG